MKFVNDFLTVILIAAFLTLIAWLALEPEIRPGWQGRRVTHGARP